MIIIELKGGLGNQMFQYAMGRAVSIKLGTNLKYYFLDNNEFTNRKYRLCSFAINIHQADKKEVKEYKSTSIKGKLVKYLKGYSLVVESDYQYLAENEHVTDNSCLVGYWQSPKYFEQFEDQLRLDFKFRDNPDKENQVYLNRIRNSCSVAVHVRRGDYIKNKEANNFHGVCSLEYYKKASKLINHEVDNATFFIFSDDISWCKNIGLLNGLNVEYVDINKGKPQEDLRLMSKCAHQVIANSSFSWWGAWLNSNENKIVIAPKKWFANSEMNQKTKNLIPNDWVRL